MLSAWCTAIRDPLIRRCPPVMVVAGDFPAQVFGWACGEVVHLAQLTAAAPPQPAMPVLHMIYVRDRFRGRGHARALLLHLFADTGPITVTHLGPGGMKAAGHRGATFNPYLVTPCASFPSA